MEKGWIIRHKWNRKIVRSLTKRKQIRSTIYLLPYVGVICTRPKIFTSQKSAHEVKKKFLDSSNWRVHRIEKISAWRIRS